MKFALFALFLAHSAIAGTDYKALLGDSAPSAWEQAARLNVVRPYEPPFAEWRIRDLEDRVDALEEQDRALAESLHELYFQEELNESF